MRSIMLSDIFFLSILALLLNSCEKANDGHSDLKLFTSLPSTITQVDFSNEIIESENFHYYNYIYSYNGGGIAAGDVNNDGLVDLFFTSTLNTCKLYLNKGGLEFEDITVMSGIKSRKGFNSGTTMVDINNDGLLDIYICRAGWFEDEAKLSNMLFINNGDLTFTEKANEYGLADSNRSITSVFFDYDKDGDLDVYISNSPVVTKDFRAIPIFDSIQFDSQTIVMLKGSDRLYNNNGAGGFTDVSEKAGLIPDRAFALNSQVGDLNNDGWLDIYVSNDFEAPDFAYINNGDGTFSESRDKLLKHMSFYSMGADMADINNDGLYDMMVLDMTPEDYIRSKTTMGMTSLDKFQRMVANGYHYQYVHNVLQLNNGNGTFSDIANMAGVVDTDWSWSPLFADFDLDGYNDLYITNGVYRDVIDQDMTTEILLTMRENRRKPTNRDFLEFTQMFPQKKMTNYFFKNMGNLTFENSSTNWIDAKPTFSNGAVYADLDNDGDLDIVVNNINEDATILRNNARELTDNCYLQFEFKGTPTNIFGVGTIVNLYFEDGSVQTRQLINSRGYLSATSNKLHFGLGTCNFVPKAEVVWPDDKRQEIFNVMTNEVLVINYKDARKHNNQKEDDIDSSKIFEKSNFQFIHKDTVFNDYQKQMLLPHKLSQTGPGVAKTDLNNDGLDDVFIGGGHTQPGQLLIAQKSGGFKRVAINAFILDRQYEDVGACFFDADNDGDQDLYVVSGSYEFKKGSPLLQDRLYINDGSGSFKGSKNSLPQFSAAGSVVVSADFDKDGDMDLFVGSRVIPGEYPFACTNYLLINNDGTFTIETENIAPELANVGMVTDAIWNDIDLDDDLDLIVTGEWMGIEVFVNESGKLLKNKFYKNLSSVTGWWNKLLIADIDEDGDKDIIAGNLGLNTRFHASEKKPLHVYTHDFDNNGKKDILLVKYYNDKQVPVRGMRCMVKQIPSLANEIQNFSDFASRDILGIVGSGLFSALHYQATEFRSGIFINEGNGIFSFSPFIMAVQQSPINSIIYEDFNGDSINDLLLAGNNYQSEVETTRSDAGIGSFLRGSRNGTFTRVSNLESGFFSDKDVRSLISVKTINGKVLIVINNHTKHDLFRVIGQN